MIRSILATNYEQSNRNLVAVFDISAKDCTKQLEVADMRAFLFMLLKAFQASTSRTADLQTNRAWNKWQLHILTLARNTFECNCSLWQHPLSPHHFCTNSSQQHLPNANWSYSWLFVQWYWTGNLQANNASRELSYLSSMQIFFVMLVIDVRRSLPSSPYTREVKGFLQHLSFFVLPSRPMIYR